MLISSLAIILLVVVTLYSAIVSFRQRPEGESASWIFPDRTKAPVRIFVGIATLLLLVGIGAWFRTNAPSIDSTKSAPRSWRFLIPEGYTGWVHVEFEIPGRASVACGRRPDCAQNSSFRNIENIFSGAIRVGTRQLFFLLERWRAADC